MKDLMASFLLAGGLLSLLALALSLAWGRIDARLIDEPQSPEEQARNERSLRALAYLRLAGLWSLYVGTTLMVIGAIFSGVILLKH